MKLKFSAVLAGVLLLAGCSQAPAQQDTSAGTTITPITFQQQCELEGIELAYEDPNAKIYQFSSSDKSVEVTTGASGAPLYMDESISDQIHTKEDLLARSNTKYQIYFWEESEEGASTLEEAAKLENAIYVSDLFPNDGKKYVVGNSSNSLAAKAMVTVNAEGEPNVAVFGLPFRQDEEDSTVVYLGGSLMANNETFQNLVNGSTVLVLYYEYNPTTTLKMGVGTRNAGARVLCDLDAEKTMINGAKDADGNAQSVTLAEYRAMSEEEKAAFNANSISLYAPVVEIYSIG